MINLTAIVTPIVVPYTGGGIDFKYMPSLAIIAFIVVTLLLLALLGILLYGMNKDEFNGNSLGPEFKATAIIIDLLTLIIGGGGGAWLIYSCISELISRI